MHELSIAMSILDIAAEESESRNGATIKTIYLRMGPLSGVVKSALISAFDLAREDSPFAISKLVIEDVPLMVFCAPCQAERQLRSVDDFCCPECGTPCGNIVSGRELDIVAMEIEE